MSHRRHAGRALATIVLLAVAAVASAGPAGAVTKTITEFQIKTPNNQPGDMVVGADNNVWFIDQATNKLGHISHTGVISGSNIPQPNSSPVGITVGPDGAIWFTEAATSSVGRFAGGTFSNFPVTANSSPRGMTVGSDGEIYYTMFKTNTIGQIDPASKVRNNTFATLPASSGPTRIASGPNGNLWVTETSSNKVAQINISNGTVVSQTTLTANAAPSRITAGPDGNIWVAEPGTNQVAIIDPSNPTTPTQISVPGKPTGITAGADGLTMWVTEAGGDAVARITIAGNAVKSFAVPTKAAAPGGIVAGPDGNIWFSENAGDKIGRVAAVSGHSSYVIVEDGRYSPASQGIPVSSGSTHKSTTIRWLFQGGMAHSVTDSSGMNLFDSGSQRPGTDFTHLFTTAGRFDYSSTVAGDTQSGTINVTPSGVKSGSDILITVATAFPNSASVDVQVKTPGSSGFVNAATNFSSSNTFTYTPSAGPGAYRFQVRTNSGANHSGFSPTITVNF